MVLESAARYTPHCVYGFQLMHTTRLSFAQVLDFTSIMHMKFYPVIVLICIS